MIPPESQPDSHEKLYFSQLREACEADDAKAAITNLMAWLGACCEGNDLEPREFVSRYGDEFLAGELAVLEKAVASQRQWTGAKLVLAANRLRVRLDPPHERLDKKNL